MFRRLFCKTVFLKKTTFVRIMQKTAGRGKSRKACILILLVATKFETWPNWALIQLLTSYCVTAILSQEHRDRRESVWSCSLCGRDGFVVPTVLVGQLRGTIKSVVFFWQALRNALPGNMVFNLCCLPLKILSWCRLCSMNSLKTQIKK